MPEPLEMSWREGDGEDDGSAFAKAMAGTRATERAWTGVHVRESVMLAAFVSLVEAATAAASEAPAQGPVPPMEATAAETAD